MLIDGHNGSLQLLAHYFIMFSPLHPLSLHCLLMLSSANSFLDQDVIFKVTCMLLGKSDKGVDTVKRSSERAAQCLLSVVEYLRQQTRPNRDTTNPMFVN